MASALAQVDPEPASLNRNFGKLSAFFRLIERRLEKNLKDPPCQLRTCFQVQWELAMRVVSVRLLAQLIKRFSRTTEGSVMMTFALMVIPIMAAIGAALDFSRASDVRASLQAALDSAVLAG